MIPLLGTSRTRAPKPYLGPEGNAPTPPEMLSTLVPMYLEVGTYFTYLLLGLSVMTSIAAD